MGTITIEEWASVGEPDNSNGVPIYKDLIKVTVDATTSTSDETITLDGRTRYVSVTAVEIHRVNPTGATTGTKYAQVNAAERRDLAVPVALKGTLSYRQDA